MFRVPSTQPRPTRECARTVRLTVMVVKPKQAATFVVGVASGGLILANWRSVIKSAVKCSIVGSTRMRKLVAIGLENITDAATEAHYELHSRSN